jgi:hypothetical protein
MARNRYPNGHNPVKTITGTPEELEAAFDKQMEAIPSERRVIVRAGDNPVTQTTVRFKIRKMPVAWGFPMDENCYSLWFTNLMGSAQIMPWDDILIPLSTYLPDARNTVHQNFVEVCKANYLMMLDSDVLPPPNFLDRLIAHKKDMVGGWYKKKGGMAPPVVYDYKGMSPETGKGMWIEREQRGQGLERVDAAGAGCWLMTRKVAVAIGSRPYSMERGGEDLELCLKVKEAGFDMFIDWDLDCAHCGVGMH